jgi:hypothetical protein
MFTLTKGAYNRGDCKGVAILHTTQATVVVN